MTQNKSSHSALFITALACLTLFFLFITGCGNTTQSSNQNAAHTKAASAASSTAMSSTAIDGDLHISILNVGQADAALIQYKGKNMLIDTGEVDSRDALVKELRDRNVQEIDAIIITHPHADHLGGMAALFNNFPIHQIYDNGISANNAMYRNYLKQIKNRNIPYQILRKGDSISFGDDVQFNVLSPSEQLFTKENSPRETANGLTNDNSIVCRMTYNNFSMLFTGDAQVEVEKQLLKDYGSQLKSDVLKVGHHGSKTASSLAFIKAVHPTVATISCAAGNRYKFPHKGPLENLKRESVQIFRVDQDGIITIISNGDTFNITKEHT